VYYRGINTGKPLEPAFGKGAPTLIGGIGAHNIEHYCGEDTQQRKKGVIKGARRREE